MQFELREQVSVHMLDEYCSELNIVPGVLKIDVEGHEIDVLLGGLLSLEHIKVV